MNQRSGSGGRSRLWRPVVVSVAALVALLAGSATAGAVSLTLVDPSPADGSRIQTTDAGATLVFAWSADRTGCTFNSSTVKLTFAGPRPFTRTITGALPNGSVEILFQTSTVEDTFSWYASMSCNAIDDVQSETRSFTNLPPDPGPRLAGRYLVNITGSPSQYWTLKPRCGTSACDTTLKIAGQPRFLLNYDATKHRYAGATKKAKGTCRLSLFRSVKNGLRGSIQIKLNVSDTEIDGAGTVASVLKGRITTRFKPTARGKRLGCRSSVAKRPITFTHQNQ